MARHPRGGVGLRGGGGEGFESGDEGEEGAEGDHKWDDVRWELSVIEQSGEVEPDR